MKHNKISSDLASPVEAEPFTEILAAFERAVRNGTRAHLDQHHVKAVMTSPVFLLLSELKQEEMSKKWEKVNLRGGLSSETIGSGTARIATTGQSAGYTNEAFIDGVSALAAARAIIRQKKR